MPKKDRVREAFESTAQQQAMALGMTPEELEKMMSTVFHDPSQISFVAPPGTSQELVDSRSFITIWPNYIDAKKTIPEGRRVPKESACPEPTVADISDLLSHFKLRHTVEPHKQYPRDFLVYGRVKVELKDAAGNPINPELPNRRSLLLKLGEMMPRLKSRMVRLEAEAAAIKAANQTGAASGGGGGSNKKKGKKGKQKGAK